MHISNPCKHTNTHKHPIREEDSGFYVWAPVTVCDSHNRFPAFRHAMSYWKCKSRRTIHFSGHSETALKALMPQKAAPCAWRVSGGTPVS